MHIRVRSEHETEGESSIKDEGVAQFRSRNEKIDRKQNCLRMAPVEMLYFLKFPPATEYFDILLSYIQRL